MRISNENLLESAVVLDEDWTSRPIWLGHIAQYSISVFFTGTPDGVFSLECSNDAGHPNAESNAMKVEGVDNWTTITGSASVVTAAGNITWNAENVGYQWVRIRYTFSASTGDITSARVNLKGI